MRFPVVFFVIKNLKILFNITSYIFYQSYLLIAFKAIATYKYLYYENSKKINHIKIDDNNNKNKGKKYYDEVKIQ